MNEPTEPPFVAANIGNSTAQFGLIEQQPGNDQPRFSRRLDLPARPFSLEALDEWIPKPIQIPWYIASVYRDADRQLQAWIAEQSAGTPVKLLRHDDFPLQVDVEQPEWVGPDRLAAAVAARHLSRGARPAIVIDAGTAITVDAVSTAGSFLGGAILPGIETSSLALENMTDLLPRVQLDQHDAPPPIGKSTELAIRSGLYWGAMGAVEKLVVEISRQIAADDSIDIYVTGGDGPLLAGRLTGNVRHVPDLVLIGVALAAVGQAPPDGLES